MLVPSRQRLSRVLVLAILGLAAVVAIVLVVQAQPRPVTGQQSHSALAVPGVPMPLTAIYTDSYEPNNTQLSAYFVGVYNTLVCQPQSPNYIVWNATFWYGRLANPANDEDWYRFQVGSYVAYTFIITRQVPSDLLFDVDLYNPNGNVIQSWRGGINPVMSFFSRDGGIYSLKLTATNAATITGTETKPYMIRMCSSMPLIRQATLPIIY